MQHTTSRAAAKTARAVAILTAVCLLFLCFPARATEALMTPIIEDISPKTAMTLTTGSTRTIEVLASRMSRKEHNSWGALGPEPPQPAMAAGLESPLLEMFGGRGGGHAHSQVPTGALQEAAAARHH